MSKILCTAVQHFKKKKTSASAHGKKELPVKDCTGEQLQAAGSYDFQ